MIKLKIKKIAKLFIIISVLITEFFGILLALPVSAQEKIQLNVPILTFTETADMTDYILAIYQASLYIIIPLLILTIMYAGILWMSAGFNEGQKTKAKKTLMQGFIGFGIVFFSYVMLSMVGIKELKSPGIQRVEPMPIPIEDGEFDTLLDIADTMGSTGAAAVAGEMPRIFQCDYRNVQFNCASKTVCSSGCGTTSVTMVLRYYGKNISIPDAVKFMASVGAIGCGVVGTSPSGFAAIAKANGLNYSTPKVDFETIKNLVINKKPVIANVGKASNCKFTKAGHYIVLSGWDAANNRFIINDPGGKSTNRYNGTWDELTKGCVFKGAYCVSN